MTVFHLTDFDTQVLSLTRITPDLWALSPDAMYHPDMGMFVRRCGGLLMQTVHDQRHQRETGQSDTRYRRLSLRGQWRVAREHAWMLTRPLPERSARSSEAAAPARQSTAADMKLLLQQQQSLMQMRGVKLMDDFTLTPRASGLDPLAKNLLTPGQPGR